MGKPAQYAWIIRVFAALIGALSPASRGRGRDGPGRRAQRERRVRQRQSRHHAHHRRRQPRGMAGDEPGGATLSQGEGPTGLSTFSGTFTGLPVPCSRRRSRPAPRSRPTPTSASTPPDAANTAEFFVFYDCTTRQVLLSCFGPYGTCPQTAQQALALLAPKVPTQGAARPGAHGVARRRGRRTRAFPPRLNPSVLRVVIHAPRAPAARTAGSAAAVIIRAMTTAISLWVVSAAPHSRCTPRGPRPAVAAGASPWAYVVGAPLLYLAVLFAFTSLWFALAWVFRAERPPEMRIGFAASAPALPGRTARDRPLRPQHGALSLRDGGPGARARPRAGPAAPRRAVQRRRDARPAQGPRGAERSVRSTR